jgi:glycosyltransferase involved in cell wall biosynthesis
MNIKEKKMAIFLPSMRGGGAERSMLRLAQGIAERDYQVDLVLAKAEGPYLKEIPEFLQVVDLKASRVLASLPGLVRYLRREQPQALLSVLDYANIVALWAKQLARVSTRLVVNDQNTISLESNNSSSRGQQLMPWLIKRFYPWADHIVGNAKGVADDLSLVMEIPREQIQVIYNPVVTPELEKKKHIPLNHPWFEADEPPVLLSVGRLAPQKDFPTLIESFARVRKTQPMRLLILGEGPERPALETLIKQLGIENDVSLPGFVENPYPYMVRAALFVLSSRWEGLPTVLIEALYCGTPIIATDCLSGAREILRDGHYGQLVSVGNVDSMAFAIETTLAGKKPRPPANSWHPFQLQPVVDQYIDLLWRN